MDHIASCMMNAGTNEVGQRRPGYIEQTNPSDQQQQPPPPPPPSQPQTQPTEQQKPFAWRMYNQPERRYQLFPKDKHPQPLAAAKALEPEQALALAMAASSGTSASGPGSATGGEKTDRLASANGLRLRIKEHTLTRRRKVSVPELGPMTTVQEVAMDSPTIPGRPPLHERSISAPGNSWRQHHLVDCMIPQYDGIPEASSSGSQETSPLDLPRCSSAQAVLPPQHKHQHSYQQQQQQLQQSGRPLSPKNLAPLVIPRALAANSSSRLRSGSAPYTPLSSASMMTTPQSASAFSAASLSTLPTPISAEGEMAGGAATSATFDSKAPAAAKSMDADGAVSEASKTHRRGQSDTGSIMERGRPRKRSASREKATAAVAAAAAIIEDAAESAAAVNRATATIPSTGRATPTIPSGPSGRATPTPINTGRATPTPMAMAGAASVMSTPASASAASMATAATGTSTGTATTLKRTASKASRSAERRAFELLPRGWKATEAGSVLGATEVAALAMQARQQAARFEVLRKEDVDSLSRELRSLDERTEYLRRTYTSLRAGRRNLHSRICQFLRSPRVARFSHDSILKQEEALAELDASIDDWVTKLEQAENRRTRVRQKLLEHVAAAATLEVVTATGTGTSSPSTATSPETPVTVVGVSECLQQAMGVKPPTPPYTGHGASHGHTRQASSQGHTQGHGHGQSLGYGHSHSRQQASMSTATPPRSPTKAAFVSAGPAPAPIVPPVASCPSPSPQRPKQVPSTILEQPLVEEAMAVYASKAAQEASAAAFARENAQAMPSSPEYFSNRRVDVESIRIYAGDDVYALLADVESQITSMGQGADCSDMSDDQRRKLNRAHSQELLNGNRSSTFALTSASASAPALSSTPKQSPPASPTESIEIFLTSAVFRPEQSAMAA